MNNNDVYILKLNIKLLIGKKFIKLNINEKTIICNYIFKTCQLLSKYYYSDKFIDQLLLNDCQDIMSLFVLLLPFYELDTSSYIENLSEIFNNSKKNAKYIYKSTYYIDHIVKSNEDIINYFENSLKLIEETLRKTAYKLLTNWLNIFPYTLYDYYDSDIYENLDELTATHNFKLDNLKIGYNTLYGTIVNFLYNDIKKIKWMIYDIIYDDNTIPTIIYINEKIQINNINNNDNFEKSEEYNNSLNLWNNLNDSEIINFKSLILFYVNFKKPIFDEKINRCIN